MHDKVKTVLPVISNSNQVDFLPAATSSGDINVWARLGFGDSYFSFGIISLQIIFDFQLFVIVTKTRYTRIGPNKYLHRNISGPNFL